MDNMFYMVINGQQTGPWPENQLIANGLTPETYVWTQGMENWKQAKEVEALAPVLSGDHASESAFGDYAVNYEDNPKDTLPPPVMPGTGSVNPYPAVTEPHTNWVPLAIVGTICGFLFSCLGLIFGIIGLVNANKANNLYAMNRNFEARQANNTAKGMVITSLIIAALGLIFILITVFTGGLQGMIHLYN